MTTKQTVALALIAALLGCVSTDQLAATTTSGSGGAADAGPGVDGGGGGAGGGGGSAGAAPAPIRTVMQRNPFGDVAQTQNLLWDGDFEWYSAFSDEYGWLAGATAQDLGFTFSDIRLGPACHSGLKCGGLKAHTVIAGVAVASQGNKLEVSFWAHVAKGACDAVTATITDFDAQADPDVAIPPLGADPDPTGWCQFDAVVDARQAKPVLYIKNGSDGDVVIDDAVITKVAPMAGMKALHGPKSPEVAAELDAVRASLHRLRGPHDAPPNAARRAYEQWRHR